MPVAEDTPIGGAAPESMRIALVHDFWVHVRGGERMFLAFTRMFPNADCYVLVQRREALASFPPGRRLHASLAQRIPFVATHFRAALPIYPWAARRLDLRGYDLVLSSSSAFCHAARTDGLHVCYCYSPLRYAWHEYDAMVAAQRFPPARIALGAVLRRVREADYAAAQRVDAYIAISRATQERIKTFYGRESVIVHPFVDTVRFAPRSLAAHPSAASAASIPAESYFLVVSQLLPYKRVDLAVQACTRLGKRLVVVGEGPERARLEQFAGPSVTFHSHVTEAELARLYAGCDALLQCGAEDFGLTVLEAQACGRPALAYGVGGAQETILPGVSGAWFDVQSVEAVADALQSFDPCAYDPQAVRAYAEQFDESHFVAQMRKAITQASAPGAASPSESPSRLVHSVPGRLQ